MQKLHPLRLQFEMFSDANPLMAGIGRISEWVRDHRSPAASNNPFGGLQEALSRQIVTQLDFWRDVRDAWTEQIFFSTYGSPAVQAIAGVGAAATRPMRKMGKNLLHNALLQARIAELRSRIPVGELREAMVRSLLYVGMARGAVDERGFEMVRRIRHSHGGMSRLSLAAFKALVRDQYLMLLIDPEASMAALPSMLPPDREMRLKALDALKQILSARGEMAGDAAERMQRIERLFRADQDLAAFVVPTTLPAAREIESRKAS
jgi:hypothetical protein